MADWSKPTLVSYEIDVLDELKERDESSATMFDDDSDDNKPVGSIQYQWNQGIFRRWNGNNWNNTTVSVAGGGTGANNASGARVNLGANNASNLNTGTIPIARVQQATTSQRGAVQLNDSTNSTSTTQAATANAVRKAIEVAEQAATGLESRNINTGSGLQGGGNLSQDRTLSVDTSVARTSTTITAGNGLSGGGNIAANRTISLGTPGTITSTSSNSVSATSHTHALGNNSVGLGQLISPSSGNVIVYRGSSGSASTTSNSSWVSFGDVAHILVPGTVTLYVRARTDSTTCEVRFLINGSTTATLSTSSGSYTALSVNRNLSLGDRVTMEFRVSPNAQRTVYVTDFQIRSNSANIVAA